MAKKALLDVLEQTIGKYVRGLDADALNVAVWSGKISLQNLELDVEAVNSELERQAAEAPNLALPFRVRFGKFRRFEVDVPWAHLMSRPLVLRAQGLEVSVEPYDRTEELDQLYHSNESEASRAFRLREERVRSIQMADDFRKKSMALRKLANIDDNSNNNQGSSANTTSTSSSFGSRLARRIVENIQMEISNVHISLASDDGSAGVVLETLQLVTTDKDGNRKFIDRTSGAASLEQAFLHKALEITGLGVYLNEPNSTTTLKPMIRLLSSIQEDSAGSGGSLQDRSYILQPLSFEARLRQADTNACIDYPKYALVSELSALSIQLSRSQVDIVRKFADQIRPANDSARPLFPEYRPLSRVSSENAREWWKYAVRCIGRINGRRSWVEFFRAFRIRKEYILLFKRNTYHAGGGAWLDPLTPTELAALDRIERDRSISVEGLMIWRTIADAQFEREQEKHNAKKVVAQSSLFSSIFGPSVPKGGAKPPRDDEPPISLSAEEMKELETATMVAVSDNEELSGDSKLCDVKFTLGQFDINVTAYDLRELAALNMGTVSTSFDANVDGSFEFDLRLTSLEIYDKVTPNTLFPTVLRNQRGSEIASAEDDAFRVHLNKSSTGDQTLHVVLNAFEAVASPTLLVELKRFLSVSPIAASSKSTKQNPMLAQSLSGSVDLFYDATEGTGTPTIEQVTSESREPEESYISSRMAEFSLAETISALTIDLDLQAPILVIPENCVDSRANILVFDMGHLRLHWLKGHEESKQHGALNLTSLAFLVGKVNDWRRLAQKHESADAISSDEAVIEPMSASVDIVLETQQVTDSASAPASTAIVHAKFSSLNVNWNPQVVKMIASELEQFRGNFGDAEQQEGPLLISSSPSHRAEYKADDDEPKPKDDKGTSSALAVRLVIELERFRLMLNSAQDGLPLFVLTMSGAKVSRNPSLFGGVETFLVLDDVSISSPGTGRTDPTYRTVLGLSPGLTESLLTVKYYEGRCASEKLPDEDSDDVEAYGDVELSPMRMVYIHAQVLALVEYATEGIMGALASQVATTAASAAAELATASSSRKVFHVKATGLEVLLPQAAFIPSAFSIFSGSLAVTYTAMANASSSTKVNLSGFELRDPGGRSLQDDHIQMNLDVLLPPEDVGSADDQAMRISVAMPNAGFIVPKSAYSQLLATLAENIGELDLFLRDDGLALAVGETTSQAGGPETTQLTHAGAVFVDKPRRMYISVDIGTMSLELAATNQDDPIVRLAAVDAAIRLNSFPDEQRTVKSVKLRNLVCDDQRIRAVTRQYRSLVYQQQQEEDSGDQQVFSLVHESREDVPSQSIEVTIGSSNMVFIPDAVADVMSYLGGESPASSNENVDIGTDPDPFDVIVDVEEEGVETAVGDAISTTTISIKTLKCSLILVDLGSDALLQPRATVRTTQVASVAETFVFKGRFEAEATLGTSLKTGEVQKLNSQLHGDELECYSAFGRDLESALQVLEPTKVALYLNMKHTSPLHKSLGIRAATMETVDVTMSMRNVALMNAILTSISSCFDTSSTDNDGNGFLDEKEAERIEHLAFVLEREDTDVSSQSQPKSTMSVASSFSVASEKGVVIPNTATTIHLTAPSIVVTVVNDLQGMDEPLFRISAQNSVANAKVRDGQVWGKDKTPFTLFDFNTHVSVLADFFDQSTNSWKPLLLKAWELSTKGTREPGRKRFKSVRPSTMIDIECFPCYISFSEQFLMGLASASNMWSVYSCATEAAKVDAPNSKHLRKSLAASAARKFVVALPYAIENHTGAVVEFLVSGEKRDARACESGSVEYFRFMPPRGRGSAGKRKYGQDVLEKTVQVLVGNTSIPIRNIDLLPGTPRRAYLLDNYDVIMIDVVREGKTVVVHLSSGFEIKNDSSVSVAASLVGSDGDVPLGVCEGQGDLKPSVLTKTGRKISKSFGVPVHLARSFWSEWRKSMTGQLRLDISPDVQGLPEGYVLVGRVDIDVDANDLQVSGRQIRRFEVVCRPSHETETLSSIRLTSGCDSFVVRVSMAVELVDGRFPSVMISIEPRARLENMLPISIAVRSPMPHIIGPPSLEGESDIFELKSGSCIEIYTPGPSVAITIKCSDLPVGGTATGWMDGGWVDLPLVSEFRLPEPLRCLFPSGGTGPVEGTEFFITQGSPNFPDSYLQRVAKSSQGGRSYSPQDVEVSETVSDSEAHRFYVTVCNFAVDHTGDILFERVAVANRPLEAGSIRQSFSKRPELKPTQPLGAYATAMHRGRITLLPGVRDPIRLLHLTMEGDEGVRRSTPFSMEEIAICDGGVDSTPLKWENGFESGFFAYRQLVSFHQSEIHVVPEYVVFNGSKEHQVRVRQPGGLEFTVEPGAIAPLRTPSQETAVVSIECVPIQGRTAPLRVDSLGLRVAVVKSQEGYPLGSLALQTVVGGRDSRLVVKLGEVKFSAPQTSKESRSSSLGPLGDDFLRFRVQWSSLQISMYEARAISGKGDAFVESAMDRITQAGSPASPKAQLLTRRSGETWVDARERHAQTTQIDRDQNASALGPVCTVVFQRFTIDWQRVFKDNAAKPGDVHSPERSQLSLIIHHIQVKDDTPGSPFPIVLQSTANISFLDLCIRFRGALDAELIRVDLFDLNLAHVNGVSERIVINTSEDFVWKFLDLANRIVVAAGEFAGVDIELAWDDEHDGYKVLIRDKKPSYIEDMSHYTPPDSDTLLDVRRALVSPFTVVISFKRNPQASRYALLKGVRGANIMNYFTRHLKFTIDRAELKFARYEVHNVKGPPDRLWELISTVYASRMKFKFVTLMSAASFQDWKTISNRDDGDDDFVEGDILRAAGNLSGKSAGYLLKKTGRGLGKGVSFATGAIGNGIENASEAIGIKPVGAGVNSVVSGVGDGAAQTLSGVGQGAGKVFQGVGQGVGHVLGGVSGGALMIGKGIGKGITGDGKGAVSGLSQGVTSLGTGVGQGVESVVTGTADGVLSVGKGLFSGVKSVGKGIGGAFTGKKPPPRRPSSRPNNG